MLVDHAVLATVPALANAYAGRVPPTGSAAWWWFATPLHLLWDGPAAVMVFFVLSGYVLALPAARRGGAWFDRGYYPRRAVRLYLPVWAALVVAYVAHRVVTHEAVPGATWWLDKHAVEPTIRAAAVLAALVLPASGQAYTTVLWSLRWEVVFSIALPAVLGALVVARRRTPPAAAAAIAAALVGLVGVGTATGHATLEYLPVFVLGSLVAFHTEAVGRVAGRLPAWPVLTVGAVALVGADTAAGVGAPAGIGQALTVAGAVIVLVAALRPGRFAGFLQTRPVRWLGTRSYSLYLVHEPLLVAVAFAMGGRPSLLALLAVAVPLSLVATEAFWRACEAPAVALAARAGRAARRR